jgi:imidazolonepropionase-like amidohydrolase
MMQDLLITNAQIWTLAGEVIDNGYLTAKDGKITEVKQGPPPADLQAINVFDAQGQILMPGLVDCHTHLMEYATSEVHKTQGQAQAMAGVANLLLALKSGIVALGEHHLGHPVLAQPLEVYQRIARELPMTVELAFGSCWLGFEPAVLTAATRPGQAFTEDILTDEDYNTMAAASDFAGENFFLNYTCANAPLSAVPHAGETTISSDKLKHIVDIFHSQGKKIGAHIEGDESARMFIEAGGDVIHHGHGISPEIGALMAENQVHLVVTPLAGTSKRPTSPQEAYGFYKQGVFMALASDSYIPPHPEADWIDLPKDHLAGPADFLTICQPVLKYFLEQGVTKEEALKLITVNGRKILRPQEPDATLTTGRPADMILSKALPGIETTSPEDISLVITRGQVQVNRL